MEQTDKQLEIINKVLDMLSIVYDSNDFNFDRNLGQKFQLIFESVKSIHLNQIVVDFDPKANSLFSVTKNFELIDKKFERLLKWKSNYKEITAFKQELETDVEQFITKQSNFNVNYGTTEKDTIKYYYINTSIRLLKVKDDFSKVKEVIFESLKAAAWIITKPNTAETSVSKTFTLAPAKKEEFFAIIAEMYEHQFFSTTSTELITKHDVLIAFGNLMQIKLEELPTSAAMPTIAKLISTPVSVRSFPDYLLYQEKEKLATALKNEFSTEKGKSIRIMIEALIQYNPPLLSIGNRGNKDLYNAINLYFQRKIGSYSGIFSGFDQNSITRNDIENFQIKIKHLIGVIEEGKTT